MIISVVLIATATLVAGHFSVVYPPWRANTLEGGTNYSQWIYPCGNVPAGTPANRTDWPLDGGSLILDLHHPWTYVFVNLGLGENATNFNYTLTEPFWNETGSGALCVPKLALPSGLPISDGSKASLQVVTLGASGNALYNCADITFRSDATPLNDTQCVTAKGVSFSPVNEEVNGSTNGAESSPGSAGNSGSSSSSSSATSSATGSATGGAGPANSVGAVAVFVAAAATVLMT